jgi:hypothetical protein
VKSSNVFRVKLQNTSFAKCFKGINKSFAKFRSVATVRSIINKRNIYLLWLYHRIENIFCALRSCFKRKASSARPIMRVIFNECG